MINNSPLVHPPYQRWSNLSSIMQMRWENSKFRIEAEKLLRNHGRKTWSTSHGIIKTRKFFPLIAAHTYGPSTTSFKLGVQETPSIYCSKIADGAIKPIKQTTPHTYMLCILLFS
jgi:hypothetical protein